MASGNACPTNPLSEVGDQKAKQGARSREQGAWTEDLRIKSEERRSDKKVEGRIKK
jgi:hypothetical protein